MNERSIDGPELERFLRQIVETSERDHVTIVQRHTRLLAMLGSPTFSKEAFEVWDIVLMKEREQKDRTSPLNQDDSHKALENHELVSNAASLGRLWQLISHQSSLSVDDIEKKGFELAEAVEQSLEKEAKDDGINENTVLTLGSIEER